jgi:hypothetical protein
MDLDALYAMWGAIAERWGESCAWDVVERRRAMSECVMAFGEGMLHWSSSEIENPIETSFRDAQISISLYAYVKPTLRTAGLRSHAGTVSKPLAACMSVRMCECANAALFVVVV